ncbi:sulfatase [Parapedobacter sp. 2B3]|uniref:sulfatase n=1 Tax=Parapedobacter sp. 2B3 TaxID=3342381 RepID=UPI0035B5AD9A
MTRTIPFIVASILLIGCSERLCGQQSASPNIVLILADDLGWSSLSTRMDKADPQSASDYHETPNLDRLAASGMRFSQAYAPASICSPSRRSILYGHTPSRQGDESFETHYQPAAGKYPTLPQVLKGINSQYKTAHLGKWDIRAGFSPEDAGYDESDGDTGNKNGNFAIEGMDKWTDYFITGDPKRANTLAARAANFMTRQAKAGTPFFLQISHYATHVEKQTTAESYEKYQKRPKGTKHDDPAFAGMLEDLDRSIGAVLDTLERLGIAENTYVFFMADNGATEFMPAVRNRLDHPSQFDKPMRNYPLRGGKWTLYEGGIRVPFLVMGPGITAGSQCDVPVAGWDLLATFAELAGENAGAGAADTDGGSFVRQLSGETDTPVVRANSALVFHRYNDGYPHSAVIHGDYKLLKFWKSGKVELYNLKEDRDETHDIADENPGKVKELAAEMTAYFQKVNPELLTRYQ